MRITSGVGRAGEDEVTNGWENVTTGKRIIYQEARLEKGMGDKGKGGLEFTQVRARSVGMDPIHLLGEFGMSILIVDRSIVECQMVKVIVGLSAKAKRVPWGW